MRPALALLLVACATEAPVELDTTPAPSGCDPEAQLDAATVATEHYRDVQVALDDGYVPTGGCDADDDGAAMGIHYVRLADSLDQEVELEAPDILLYVPEGDDLRLVGIEYVVPALLDGETYTDPDEPAAGTWAEPPELFCRPFDGPMAGHNPLQPWHYDLHVWVHTEPNPDGRFAPYHPGESCGG